MVIRPDCSDSYREPERGNPVDSVLSPNRSLSERLVVFVELTCPFLFAQDWNDPVKPVNTATPQQHLGGDLFQILNSAYQSGVSGRADPPSKLPAIRRFWWERVLDLLYIEMDEQMIIFPFGPTLFLI